ncbi:MAG: CPBP family intramembrane metalloprotease [Deltaproteobacteria bacterium]|nr:CPBP family intramembrane metalloprotease [Deltaproteobacteria bacterium]
MSIDRYIHPLRFYFLSTAIPWACWFAAAYISHQETRGTYTLLLTSLLGVVGLAGPMVVAFWMMAADPVLRVDLTTRLFRFQPMRPVYLLITCLLMLGSILLAQAISLLFGHSVDQFRFAGGFSFSAGLLPAWVPLILAPVLEELAWHSYGTDCLRRRMSLFATSMLFGVFWVLWHVPLSFIRDYYHSNVVETGWLYGLNFAVSLFPYVLLMNWLYYKTNRNLYVTIVFHISAGLFNEMFMTHPDSKVIQTVLLTLLTIWLVMKERRFFFQRAYTAAD